MWQMLMGLKNDYGNWILYFYDVHRAQFILSYAKLMLND